MIHKDGDGIVKKDKEQMPDVPDLTDTDQMVQNLRERETRLNAFFQGAPVPTFVIDQHRRVRRWNRALEALTGIPAADVMGKREHWRAFYTKERPCLADLLLEGDPTLVSRWYGEKKIRPGLIDEAMEATDFFPDLGKSGRWLRFTASVIRSSQGEILGAVETLEDITDQKLAEAALRDKEEKYRRIAENISDVVWMTDMDLKLLYVSPSVERMVGEPAVVHMERPLEQRFPSDSLEMLLMIFAEELEKEKEPACDKNRNRLAEVRHFRADGSIIWVSINMSFIRDKNDVPVGIMGVSRDITDRRRTEEALRESESRFRLFSEMAPVGVVIEDHAKKNLYVSQKFVDMFGYTNQELPSAEAWWPLAYPDTSLREKVRREWAATVAEAKKTNFEIRPFETPVTCKDGTVRDIEFRMRIADKLNFIMLTDITERKQAEAEREKLQAQLIQARKMESVGRLAGGVAHDFNNMLSVILGHTELAMDQTGPDHLLYEDLQEINRAAERSADLTRQLLAFARKQTIAPRVLDLNETVEGMLRMLRRLIGENIDLIWEPATRLWPVKMDPSQIDQILANLCINAKDALGGGGRILIETDNRSLDDTFRAEHPGFVAGDYVELSVSDNGCGMNREVLSNLFEPFFTTKNVGEGTGLGLATIYGIVKQNNGFIFVDSEPGQGSVFKIYLPRHAVSCDHAKVPEFQPEEIRGDETILLVEDEPAILKMTRAMLESLGYRVITAGNPADAIRTAEHLKEKIHLLITDVVMPGMNGRELAEKLEAFFPDLKILFISGYTADVIAHFGVLDDGLHFVQKPFSKRDLQYSVRNALEQERLK